MIYIASENYVTSDDKWNIHIVSMIAFMCVIITSVVFPNISHGIIGFSHDLLDFQRENNGGCN